MKHIFLASIAFLAAASCSTDNQESNTSGFPGFKRPKLMLNLHCVETKTFADVPGFESLLAIERTQEYALVQQRPVQLRGQEPAEWKLDENNYKVIPMNTSEVEAQEGYHLSENINKEVDWSQQAGCFKMIPQKTFRVNLNKDGKWVGEAVRIPSVVTNPAVPDCSFPEFSLPMPSELSCQDQLQN